jgi:hypothetical protein
LKQLNSVTVQPVPAPAKIRPPGKNLYPLRISKNLFRHHPRSRFNSSDGTCDAPPGVFNCLVPEVAIFFMAVFGLPDVVCDLGHRQCKSSLDRVRLPSSPALPAAALIQV